MLASADNDRDVRAVVALVNESAGLVGVAEVERGIYRSTNPGGEGCCDGDDRRAGREKGSYDTESTVVLPEVGAPMDNAMRFVNKKGKTVIHEGGVAQDTVGEGA